MQWRCTVENTGSTDEVEVVTPTAYLKICCPPLSESILFKIVMVVESFSLYSYRETLCLAFHQLNRLNELVRGEVLHIKP